MKFKYLTYIAIVIAILMACSKENIPTLPDFPNDDNWKEEIMNGASATVKRFEPGDEVTRSTFNFTGQGYVFGWTAGDKIGLYPTTNNDGPVDPEHSSQSLFICQGSSSQTTKIDYSDGNFVWDEIVRWTAYFPYSQGKEDETYANRTFSFKNQTQQALPEIGKYFDYEDATNPEDRNKYLNEYQLTEAKACKHLGDFDVMISPETQWVEGTRINFQLRHVGSFARFYLTKIEAGLVIKDIKLICDKAIFYEGGTFNLSSHPYNADAPNFGVDLNRESDNCQISPSGDPVKMLQLNFTNTCVTKKTGTNNNWGPYVVGYLMMYPITYNPATDGNLFAYVTAYRQGDNSANEIHYVSVPLAAKTMESGKYYQWNAATHPDDGLYPIEMTATLKSWQEIVGAGIETDLEK